MGHIGVMPRGERAPAGGPGHDRRIARAGAARSAARTVQPTPPATPRLPSPPTPTPPTRRRAGDDADPLRIPPRAALLGVATLFTLALLALAAPTASAIHGGVGVEAAAPAAFGPGDRIFLQLSDPGQDPTDPFYLATDVILEAPVLNGTELSFLPGSVKPAFAERGTWQVDSASPGRVHWSWDSAGQEAEEEVTFPAPPMGLQFHMSSGLPIDEGPVTWEIQFCTTARSLAEMLDLPLTIPEGAMVCPATHTATAEVVYDRKDPVADVAFDDPRGNTESPFHESVTFTVSAEDGGAGVKEIWYHVKEGTKIVRAGTVQGASSGPVQLPSTGGYRVSFGATDGAGNRASGGIREIVVADGLKFVSYPEEAGAGEPFTVFVDVVRNMESTLTRNRLTEADFPIDVAQASGPGTLQVVAASPTQSGRVAVQFVANETGTYTLEASADHLPSSTSPPIHVGPGPLETLRVSPASAQVAKGGTLEFTAEAFDALGNPIPPVVGWGTDCGSIVGASSGSATYTAPDADATCHVLAAMRGHVTKATVTVGASSGGSGGGGAGTGGTGGFGGTGGGGTGGTVNGASARSVQNLRSHSHEPGVWNNSRIVVMEWDPPADGEGLEGYSFVLRPVSDPTEPSPRVRTTQTAVPVPAESDGELTFRVRPVYAGGEGGDVLTYGPVRIDTDRPDPPQDLTAELAGPRVRLAWGAAVDDPSGVSGYVVERRTAEASGDGWTRLTSSPLGADARSVEDTDIQSGSTYMYRVRALDRAGNLGTPSAGAAVKVHDVGTVVPLPEPAVAEMYRVLGIQPASRLEALDQNKDGHPEALAGDGRLRVIGRVTVGGEDALIVAVATDGDFGDTETGSAETEAEEEARSRSAALIRVTSGKVEPVALGHTRLGQTEDGERGPVVYVRIEQMDSGGWTYFSAFDKHPRRGLIAIRTADGRSITNDVAWRADGHVHVLDRADGSVVDYRLYYGSPGSRTGDGAGDDEGLPGVPSLPGFETAAVVAVVAGAAWFVGRRHGF